MVPLGRRFAQGFFALQGLGGAAWWGTVWLLPGVRQATLGRLPLEFAFLDVPLFVLGSLLAALAWRPAVWTVLGWTAVVAVGMAVETTLTREAAWGTLLMTAALAGTAFASAELLLGHVPTEWLVQGPFVFRTTPDAEGHLARTLRQLVAFWLMFLGILPVAVVLLERRWRLDVEFPLALRTIGLAIFALASSLGLASAFTMARRGEGSPLPCAMPKRLVVAGPYRIVRNPMAVAGIGQGVAVGLMAGSWLVVAYALVGSAIWNWAVRPHEEADLAARFGTEFGEYRSRVNCWVPKRLLPRGRVDERVG